MSQSHPPIRVLIIDDHSAISPKLSDSLTKSPDIEVVGQIERISKILPFLTSHEVDILLLNIKIHGQSSINIARSVHDSHPSVKTIILTTHIDYRCLPDTFEVGVCGFLFIDTLQDSLPDSIRAVMDGERLLSPSLLNMVLSNFQTFPRE